MKISFNSNNNVSSSKDDSVFFKKLCNETPYLVINTPCGVGKYKFHKIGYNINNDLVLEYELINDSRYADSNNIIHKIGQFYYLSATQLLYAFKFYANS